MKKILLAVSGGIDSMYMANRASELFPEAHFAVAHCNFQLRGEESDGDEAFVREWCEKHSIECFIKSFNTREYASNQGISIEMAARQLRYEWFEQLCAQHGFDAVATAHNACDNAETLLLNLLRGTGVKGICGMSSSERILRPLLNIERSEIEAWMREQGQVWREDSSNQESIYKRNLIRQEVFPLFAKLNPSYIKTLNGNMARFAQVSAIAEDFITCAKTELIDSDGSIEVSKLLNYKHWQYALWGMLEDSGINSSQYEELVDCLSSGRQLSGKRFGPIVGAPGHLIIRQEQQEREILIETLSIKDLDSFITEPGTTLIDAEKVPQPLKIREWRDGDWMKPLGMKGKKKLSDLFVDLKYSIVDKSQARVIEIEGSHVAAIIGVRIDESVKLDQSTEKVLRISYSSII